MGVATGIENSPGSASESLLLLIPWKSGWDVKDTSQRT